jgi:two-component system NarL family sensor kinase
VRPPRLGRRTPDRPELRRAIAWFLALNTLAILLVGGAAVGWSIAAARQQAVYFAKQSALTMANGLVAPQCTPGLRDGRPDAIETLDRVVRGRMRDGSVMRVKVWDRTGRVLYSDQPMLIGRTYELAPADVALIGTNEVTAEISTLTRTENEYEEPAGRLVEVYVGITDSVGEPLLFEAYFRVDQLDANARYIAWQLVPIALIAIVALQLLQLPLALVLARRLDHAHRKQARLLEHAVAASDVERRRIARDLHDGVIQDLAGVGYTLGAFELVLTDAPQALRDRLKLVSDIVQRDLRALRHAMVDIHPPDLAEVSLEEAVNDLATALREAGATCQVSVADTTGLSASGRQLLYRAARELLRNVAKHARASRVEITLELPSGFAVLVVRDDGVGFDPVNTDPPAGHLGMRLLREAVDEVGGRMEVSSAPGEGTVVRVVLPRT